MLFFFQDKIYRDQEDKKIIRGGERIEKNFSLSKLYNSYGI